MGISQIKKVGGIAIFLLVLLWIAYTILNRRTLLAEGRYTIGTTVGSHSTSKGIYIDYQFIVNGVIYNGSRQPEKYKPVVNGGKYFVIFHPLNPKNSAIFWEKPVPVYVEEVPLDGWEEIPFSKK
jgi:hypothetical protein